MEPMPLSRVKGLQYISAREYLCNIVDEVLAAT
jgi:hypothetical protein